jgi:small subunit ribosomal protein S4
MARYTGPKLELLVNLAKQYSEMTKHSKEEVTHLDNTGWRKKRKKSEYAIQLMEKQKAKYSYGIREAIQRFIQKSISY